MTTELLDIEDIPDFKSPPNWGIMRRLNEAKWDGIRHRLTQVDSAVEQAMYVDLLLEVINLAPMKQKPSPSVPADGLELALIKALAGKILDCEHGSTLLSTVASIMDEMK